MKELTLSIDVMGGDSGPSVTIPAAIQACKIYPNLILYLCGNEAEIIPHIRYVEGYVRRRMRVVHCPDVIRMDENPSAAIKKKSETSMKKTLELVKEGTTQACVSAGNTGALFAMSYFMLKPLEGVKRPALVSSLPKGRNKRVFLLDLGANVDSDANTLCQFALMGAVVAEEVDGMARPKIALMNVGVEQNKGSAVIKATDELLRQTDLNYVGYVEGDGLFNADVDVIVTDGFVGNVVLKASEGLAKFLIREAKRISEKNFGTKILAAFALPLLKKIYNKVNPDQYNGASLLGLRGIVVKSHGNASADAFLYAIKEAIREVDRQVPEKIEKRLNQVLLHRTE
ncbi:MAG: phosphate acyltransferase PlsX [Aestuariibacter sp.]